MEKTIEALKVYDAGKVAREAMLYNAMTNEDVFAAEAKEKEAAEMVQTAFFHEQGVNSLENCKRLDVDYIRFVATGKPSPASISIGNVGFGRIIPGETFRNGDPKWVDTHHMGGERVALLQTAIDDQPLPEGLILVGRIGSGFHHITTEAVNWESSGITRSDETRRYQEQSRFSGKQNQSRA